MAVSAPALKHEGRQQARRSASTNSLLMNQLVVQMVHTGSARNRANLVTMIAISAPIYRARARRHMAESAAAPRQARGERSTKSPNRCMCL